MPNKTFPVFRRFSRPRPLVLAAILIAITAAPIFAFTLLDIPLIHYATLVEPGPIFNGVDPDTGPSGTSFTFYVNYIDQNLTGGEFPPTKADLLIDLDGDGIVGGLVTPFFSPPPLNPAPWLGALLALGLFFLLLARHARFWRPAFSKLALVSVLFILALGCGGSDDGGGGVATASGLTLASCSSPVGETQTMVDPSGGTGNYSTTGEVFTVALTLNCEPGILLYQFDFQSNEGVPAIIGTAPNLHTLTITP